MVAEGRRRPPPSLSPLSLSLSLSPSNPYPLEPPSIPLFLFFFLSPLLPIFLSLFRSSSPSSPPFLTEPKREREREREGGRESEGGPGWDCVFEINHPPRRRGAAATCAPTILLKHNVTRNDVKIWRGLGITRTPACIREPPTTFIPFPLPARALIGNGFWQVHFARLNIKQNGKKIKKKEGKKICIPRTFLSFRPFVRNGIVRMLNIVQTTDYLNAEYVKYRLCELKANSS